MTTQQLWSELSDRLRGFIRARVATAADVDDILQTVFLRIHQNIDTLRDGDRLESWVFQIARNAVTDHFRKSRRQPAAAEQEPAAPPPVEPSPALNLSGCLAKMISELPADQQRAVRLYELEGLSQAEIARQESVSVSGAKSRIQRGRQALQTMLQECCRLHFDARGNIMDYEPVSCSTTGECGCGDAE